MSSHTQGPLHVSGCATHPVEAFDEPSYFAGGHACVAVRNAEGEIVRPTLGDLYLHAAAPDLLAALQEQVAEFDLRMREYVNGGDDEIAGIAMQHHGARMDRARAALAKARVPK